MLGPTVACPWCGHHPDPDHHSSYDTLEGGTLGFMRCIQCGARGKTVPTSGRELEAWKESAQAAWNLRKEELVGWAVLYQGPNGATQVNPVSTAEEAVHTAFAMKMQGVQHPRPRMVVARDFELVLEGEDGDPV